MNNVRKAQQLQKHKLLATSLFVLMLVVFVFTTWFSRNHPSVWIGYVNAFSEAAMVGALADWFAVTALFHHPLGIPIPHTNLIENSKKRIGDNLGEFVVFNFLTSGTIRPYILKLTVAAYVVQWLEKERNKQALITEATRMMNNIIQKIDDETIAGFMAAKGNELLNQIKLNVVVSNALNWFLNNNEHQKLVTLLASKVQQYISENEAVVKDKVKQESYFFIPKFVDNKLASKITNGLISYFNDVEKDDSHRIRTEVSEQLYQFIDKLKTEPKWEQSFSELRANLLPAEKMNEYALAAWQSLKITLQHELTAENSALKKYLSNTIDAWVIDLKNDAALQRKIDGWIHYNAYKLILKNTNKVGLLISNTVGNWQGRELSQKLELEVGKDLQFIRINGTIVGGLVGLLIHTITQLFE
jgi:uncharacterized membrane-anchored protein YjiN (DUF445 family)